MPRTSHSSMVAMVAVALVAGGCSERPVLHSVGATPTTVSTLEFGLLPVGGRKVMAVPVDNLGVAPVTVSAVATPPFALESAPPDPIPAGGKGYVMVAYEPSASGEA